MTAADLTTYPDDLHTAPQIDEFAALLEQPRRILIITHINPDADAIGSAGGLGLILQARGHSVVVTVGEEQPLPQTLQLIPGAELYRPPTAVTVAENDLVITTDISVLSRLGVLRGAVEAARAAGIPVVVIDHHERNDMGGDPRIVAPAAPSTTAMIHRIAQRLGWEMPQPAAEALYSGLVTDTGSFRWGHRSAHADALALLDRGVDAAAVARTQLDARPFAFFACLAEVLGSAQLTRWSDGSRTLVWAAVPHALVTTQRPEDLDALMAVLRTAEEASVALLLTETTPGTWRGSLRSADLTDVSLLAEQFGGGGHLRAAGFSAHGQPEEIVATVLGLQPQDTRE